MPTVKKMATATTTFAFGFSGVFRLSGAGEAWSRLLIAVIFFLAAINLVGPAAEYFLEKRRLKTVQTAKPGGGGAGGSGSGGGGSGGSGPRPERT
ncbi:MAG: hypothetical protein LBS31_12260 [Candidatus Adiutrix sp.]|nr:hypothetical protein [Candidatus Adiutrix sp.]